jgi:hypothetical protein
MGKIRPLMQSKRLCKVKRLKGQKQQIVPKFTLHNKEILPQIRKKSSIVAFREKHIKLLLINAG